MAVKLAAVPDILSAKVWASMVPNPITPATGVAAAAVALADARKIRRFVASRFRGTKPPPPWPMHKALMKARKRVRVLHQGLRVILERRPQAKLKPAVRETLIREGKILYRETEVLLDTWRRAPNTNDPWSFVPAGVELAFEMPWWVWVGAAYMFMKR